MQRDQGRECDAELYLAPVSSIKSRYHSYTYGIDAYNRDRKRMGRPNCESRGVGVDITERAGKVAQYNVLTKF